jgi:hypothetical protein
MKYSKSDGAYFKNSKKVISIKGGKLKENGKLDATDFFDRNGNNVVPKQRFKNIEFELQNMKSNYVSKNGNNVVQKQTFPDQNNMNLNNVSKYEKPIKILIQKLTKEPFIFFGYNPETKTYQYVCYNNMVGSINYNKLNGDKIVKLNHEQFINIGIEDLIVLCYHLLKIRQKKRGFMSTLCDYLRMFVFEKVINTNFHNNSHNHKIYTDMVKEIKKMERKEGGVFSALVSRRLYNGGKLDVDGKLDSRNFIRNNIDSKQEIVRRTNTNSSITGFELQGRNNSAPNINTKPVLPKEIIQKGLLKEPYIFFRYDGIIKKYRYVCYYRNPFSKIPVFRRLEDNYEISDELTLDKIKEIGNPTLLELYCFLNKKSTNRENGTQYMKRLQTYLLKDVGVEVPENRDC